MCGPGVFQAVAGVRTKTILDTIIKTLSQNLAAPVWLASSSGRDLLSLWGPELGFLGDSLLYLHWMFVIAMSLCFLYLVSLCLVLGPLLPPLGISLSPPSYLLLYCMGAVWFEYISPIFQPCAQPSFTADPRLHNGRHRTTPELLPAVPSAPQIQSRWWITHWFFTFLSPRTSNWATKEKGKPPTHGPALITLFSVWLVTRKAKQLWRSCERDALLGMHKMKCWRVLR